MITIKKTTDYSQFKTKKGNRHIYMPTVNRLVESIKEMDLTHVAPIIVNRDMEIIDGQHRLAALKKLKKPVYYVVQEPSSLREIQLLNSAGKRWSPKDFINSYIVLGNKNYEILRDFMEKYKFPFRFTMELLTGNKSTNQVVTKLFQTGKFEVLDLEDATRMADIVLRLTDFSASKNKAVGQGQGVRFYSSIMRVYKQDPGLISRMERNLIDYNLRIYRMDTERDYLRQFEDILSKGLRGRTRIRLS
jgi:hypothetical protein